jgi:hypothetical protein
VAGAAGGTSAVTVAAGRVCFRSVGLVGEAEGALADLFGAMTKHTRPGPRLGKGALVYLIEMGSMYMQSSSGRTSMTLPCTALA